MIKNNESKNYPAIVILRKIDDRYQWWYEITFELLPRYWEIIGRVTNSNELRLYNDTYTTCTV